MTLPLPLDGIHQVGIVVRDLERAMQIYWERFGIGPWRVYTYGAPLVKAIIPSVRPAIGLNRQAASR